MEQHVAVVKYMGKLGTRKVGLQIQREVWAVWDGPQRGLDAGARKWRSEVCGLKLNHMTRLCSHYSYRR